MAEFLVMTNPFKNSDPYLDVGLVKRGGVITWQADGWAWSQTELTNPNWRIIRVTGISDAEANAMLTSEPGDATNRMLQIRAFAMNLDLGSLPKAVTDFIKDDSRSTPIGVVTLAQVRAIKQQNPPVADPNATP